MKRCIQILMVFAFLLSVVCAKTETMAERKQRIERKYIQKRTVFVQGDAVVPAEKAVGEEEGFDSEKFKEPQVNLQRQEPGAVMPPPRRAPRPRPRKEAANWLLEADDSELADPDANPYAWDASAEDDTKKKPARATTEQLRRDAYSAEMRRDSWFSRRTDSASTGSFDTQGSAFGTTQSQDTSPYSSTVGRSLFGRREQDGQTTPSLFGNSADSSRTKLFGVAPSQEDPFKSPFSRRSETIRGSNASDARRSSYTPYKSPFQTQSQRSSQQSWGATTPKKQEYQKKNTFEAWKKKSPQQLDPMRDGAFIDSLMPRAHH